LQRERTSTLEKKCDTGKEYVCVSAYFMCVRMRSQESDVSDFHTYEYVHVHIFSAHVCKHSGYVHIYSGDLNRRTS